MQRRQEEGRVGSDAGSAGGGDAGRADGGEGIPEGSTLSLALADALPVVFFSAATLVFGTRLNSGLFIAGAMLSALGGAGKVAWKLLLALVRKDVRWLALQMRATMPVGFVLMVAACVARADGFLALAGGFLRLPSCAFLTGTCVCMAAMCWFAGHMDQADARANWVEQLTNATGQACLLAAVLLA